MKAKDLATISEDLVIFAREREWEIFHSPKNLAMALSVEAAELLEHFQWITEDESRRLEREKVSQIAEEAADVQIYLLMLADKLGIDLLRAAEAKIEKNRLKYAAGVVERSAARPHHGNTE